MQLVLIFLTTSTVCILFKEILAVLLIDLKICKFQFSQETFVFVAAILFYFPSQKSFSAWYARQA